MIKKFLRKIFSDVTRVRYSAPFFRNFRNTKKGNYAKAGEHTQLFGPLLLDPESVELDDYTRLQPGIKVINAGGKLVVKKYSAIGAGCTIIASEHVPTVGIPQYLSILHINDLKQTVVVEEDAWVGADTLLLSHSRIGRGSVVAAGSVVTKPVPPYAVVAGSPAKVIAVRFTLEQVLKHEAILYPPQERMTREELENLYSTTYEGLKSLGVDEISVEDRKLLNDYKKTIGLNDYESGR